MGSWKGSSVRGPQPSLAPLLYPAPDAAYLDLTGQRLKVSVVDNWPFFGLIERPNGTWEPTSGIDHRVLDMLSKKMNFTYAIIYRESSVYKKNRVNLEGRALFIVTHNNRIFKCCRRDRHLILVYIKAVTFNVIKNPLHVDCTQQRLSKCADQCQSPIAVIVK